MEKQATRLKNSPTRCPFCHDPIDIHLQAWTACTLCLARHHSDCWREHGCCSSCGGEQSLIPQNQVETQAPGSGDFFSELPQPLKDSRMTVEQLGPEHMRLEYPAFRAELGNRPEVIAIPLSFFFFLLALGVSLSSVKIAVLVTVLGLAILIGSVMVCVQESKDPWRARIEFTRDRLYFNTPSWTGRREIAHDVDVHDLGEPLLHNVVMADFGAMPVILAGYPHSHAELKWLRDVINHWRTSARPLTVKPQAAPLGLDKKASDPEPLGHYSALSPQ